MTLTPLMINLNRRKVVIVGGGLVAERRVHTLINSGAFITVISPTITDGILEYMHEGKIKWDKTEVRSHDLEDAFLVIAATDRQEVNEYVIQTAPETALINASGEAEKGNTQLPAVVRRGKLSIAVSTNGASPLLAGKIKRQLEQDFDEDYEDYLEFLNKSRYLLKRSRLNKRERHQLLEEILSISYIEKKKQLLVLNWLKEVVGGGAG